MNSYTLLPHKNLEMWIRKQDTSNHKGIYGFDIWDLSHTFNSQFNAQMAIYIYIGRQAAQRGVVFVRRELELSLIVYSERKFILGGTQKSWPFNSRKVIKNRERDRGDIFSRGSCHLPSQIGIYCIIAIGRGDDLRKIYIHQNKFSLLSSPHSS